MKKNETMSAEQIINDKLETVEERLKLDIHDIINAIREQEAAFKRDESGYALVNPAASGCPNLPCPFCGMPNATAHVDAVEGTAHRAYVTCDHCGAKGSEYVSEAGDRSPYIVQCAVTLWNRRTTIIGRG